MAASPNETASELLDKLCELKARGESTAVEYKKLLRELIDLNGPGMFLKMHKYLKAYYPGIRPQIEATISQIFIDVASEPHAARSAAKEAGLTVRAWLHQVAGYKAIQLRRRLEEM